MSLVCIHVLTGLKPADEKWAFIGNIFVLAKNAVDFPEVGILQILKAESKDFDVVYELICELESTIMNKQALYEVYSHNLMRDDIHYILAVDDLHVVGFASLHIQQLLHHAAKIGEVQEIIVRKEKQGLGIGKALFDAIKQLPLKKDACSLRCVATKPAKVATNFMQNRAR